MEILFYISKVRKIGEEQPPLSTKEAKEEEQILEKQYSTYPEAESAIKKLPVGGYYQIEKVFYTGIKPTPTS